MFISAPSLQAAQCPGEQIFLDNPSGAARVNTNSAGGFTGSIDAVHHASACTMGVAVGTMAPTECFFNHMTVISGGHGADLGARWPSNTARAAAGTMDGCSFACGGFSCFVRATDGLPVELLQFGVE